MLQLIADGDFGFRRADEPPVWFVERGKGQRSILVHRTPFVIGRAWDCHLVLQESEAVDKTTSRWHCHIIERKGEHVLIDGSLANATSAGSAKPSSIGTHLNGRKIDGPALLSPGDAVGVGHWKFGVGDPAADAVDIDGLLSKAAGVKPTPIDGADPRVQAGFGRLHELISELHSVSDTPEALGRVFQFVLKNIRAANVAAVLVDGDGGTPEVLDAWERGKGRTQNLRFSWELVRQLDAGKAYVLNPRIADRSPSQMLEKIDSALLLPLGARGERQGILYLDNRGGVFAFTEQDLYLANALASIVALQLSLEKQKRLHRVEQNMRRYFGPNVVKMIVQQSAASRSVQLGVQQKNVSILFVDMQGFSAEARRRSPLEVADLINPYLQIMSQCIQSQGGHVDKFIGDAVMGVFGGGPLADDAAPEDSHAVQAVEAARKMIWEWGESDLPIRVGIASGDVVIGNIGFPGRMEFSALGDIVNLAARLEKQASPSGIAISEKTRALLEGRYPLSPTAEIALKGFGAVPVWHLDLRA